MSIGRGIFQHKSVCLYMTSGTREALVPRIDEDNHNNRMFLFCFFRAISLIELSDLCTGSPLVLQNSKDRKDLEVYRRLQKSINL